MRTGHADPSEGDSASPHDSVRQIGVLPRPVVSTILWDPLTAEASMSD